MDKHGAALLAERWGIAVNEVAWSIKDRALSLYFYKHLLLTGDIRIALTLAAQAHGLAIALWKDEKTLKREHHADPITIPTPDGKRKRTWVEPDGYLYLTGAIPSGTMKRHMFLEIDRGTESGTAQSEQK